MSKIHQLIERERVLSDLDMHEKQTTVYFQAKYRKRGNLRRDSTKEIILQFRSI